MVKLINRSIKIFVFTVLFAGISSNAYAASEYAVKSAIIYKITKFVQLPRLIEYVNQLNICVVGENPFGRALDAVNGKSTQGKNIKIFYLKKPGDYDICHIAFLRPEDDQLESWIKYHNEKGILTISDIEGFAKSGGMVELQLKGKRIGFLINRDNASQAGFNFKSQLLRLAKIVKSQGD